jgi:hypothetical protein
LDVLQRGYVWKSKLGLEEPFSEWIAVVSTELLYESYREFAQRDHDRHPMDRESFGRFMVRMGGKPTRRRGLVTREHIENHPEHGRRPAVVCRKNPANGYMLGALETARAGFIAATNLPIDWQDGASDEERADD